MLFFKSVFGSSTLVTFKWGEKWGKMAFAYRYFALLKNTYFDCFNWHKQILKKKNWGREIYFGHEDQQFLVKLFKNCEALIFVRFFKCKELKFLALKKWYEYYFGEILLSPMAKEINNQNLIYLRWMSLNKYEPTKDMTTTLTGNA